MAAQLQIDQEGLPTGTPGVSRTDGLDTGAVVTLTNTGAGSTTVFRLLWVPPGDTTAVATLAPTEGDLKVWTFTPSEEVYGSYRIELVQNEGLTTEVRERRIFAVRTPGLGFVIPALNEAGDPRASLLVTDGLSENNAVDYNDDATLNDLTYAGWWRSFHEMVMKVDGGQGSYVGQPFAWDGESWAPAVALGVSQITNANGLDLNLARIGDGDVWRSSLYLGNYYAQLTSYGPVNFTSVDGGNYSISGAFHSFGADFDGSNVEILRLGLEGDSPTIGFIGAARVSRPSITGSTTGEQIDSLVEALVALGLVSDERPPP